MPKKEPKKKTGENVAHELIKPRFCREFRAALATCLPPNLANAAELRGQPRSCQDSATRALDIIRHFCDSAKCSCWPWPERVLMVSEPTILNAQLDCLKLDMARRDKGLTFFYQSFTVFDTAEALRAILEIAFKDFLEWTKFKTPSGQAAHAGQEELAYGKSLLARLTEKLEDGESPEVVLRRYENEIMERVRAGNVQFFEDFGDRLKDHRLGRRATKKPLSDFGYWIPRLWLPLCLWECPPDGGEAHTRYAAAALLLGYSPSDGNKFYKQFLEGWNNVRKRSKKPI